MRRLPLLRENAFDAGGVTAQGAEHVRLLELATLLLNAQVEYFLPDLALAGVEFLECEFLDFGDFHGALFCGVVTREEACAHGELVRGEAQGFAGDGF